MRRILIVLVAGAALTAAQDRFSFAIIGDRTGSARPDTFRMVMEEIGLLAPDFIIGTGDLIEGYTEDIDTLNAQWDEILGLFEAAGIPRFGSPGNHDIINATSESLYLARVGPTRSTSGHANAFFIFANNTRWRGFSDWPDEQRRWFRSELKKAKKYDHAFVLMHRPYWRYAREAGVTDTIHQWCLDAGVDYVITGHDHFYCSAEFDGIRYFQVGPSGSRYKVYDDPAQGAFQNYMLCRVDGKDATFSVIKPGAVLPTDIVTWDALAALDRAREKAIDIEPLVVDAGNAFSAQRNITIRDLADTTQAGRLAVDWKRTAWEVKPGSLSFLCGPGASCRYTAGFTLTAPDRVYPLPKLVFPYRYAPGRVADITKRLPVDRRVRANHAFQPPTLDGVLDDSCWLDARPVTGFGSRSGAARSIERTTVFVAFDSTTLYIGAKCRESHPERVSLSITDRDAKVYKDDHLNFVLDPDRRRTLNWAARMDSVADGLKEGKPVSGPYYQVFVSALGTVSDRVCRMEGDRSNRDYSWNGDWKTAVTRDDDYWTVEMSCPLSSFESPAREWGLNVVRLQKRLDATSHWKAPFRHDPRSFGILQR